ncbi:hypothetical protein EBZ39_04855 [bacterium]|nr:hypothetical protein [bacterium]
MATIDLSLGDLYAKAFGYNTNAFKDNLKYTNVYKDDNKNKRGSVAGAGYWSFSREYYLPVTLRYVPATGGSYVRYELPHPIIRLTQEKTIICTPLTERAGTVKELVREGDVEIMIRGLLISNDNELPEEGMIALQRLYKSSEPVIIENVMTDILLSEHGFKAAVKSLNFPEVQGVKGVRGYELSLISDSVFNLEEI